jgi:hypothetical protein
MGKARRLRKNTRKLSKKREKSSKKSVELYKNILRHSNKKMKRTAVGGSLLTSIASGNPAAALGDIAGLALKLQETTSTVSNVPGLVALAQQSLTSTATTALQKNTEGIRAGLISAVAPMVSTAVVAAAAGKDVTAAVTAVADKVIPMPGQEEGEGEEEGDGEGDGENYENTGNSGNSGNAAEYENAGNSGNAEYENAGNSGNENYEGGRRRKKRTSKYPNKTKRFRKY